MLSGPAGPLTVGTAGHVDHGKTALVAALSGVDTDRLAEEKRRGLSIELGYAPLTLPSGRRLSLVDVPGHERLIRTMVAGASGIDCYMMVIAATEGAMPQTREHAQILRALAIEAGIVVITKTDLADPAAAIADARRLLPRATVVACPPLYSERRGPVLAALDDLTRGRTGRAAPGGGAVMHVDRCFTIAGAGTVVTGTLSGGEIKRADTLVVYPREFEVRVRGVQVHGAAVDSASAGQRVAVNLARVARGAVARGDVLATAQAVQVAYVIDVRADFALPGGKRVLYVHHGTRATLARVRTRAGRDGAAHGNLIQLRCQTPLVTRPGDRLVLRDAGARETLGGAVVMSDGPSTARGEPSTVAASRAGQVLAPASGEPGLVRLAHGRHASVEAVAAAEAQIRALIAEAGYLTLPGLRDRLGSSRSQAKAFLDYFDTLGLTRRRADDTRILRRAR